ncbi:hypothetical protein [Actinoplanes sp. NPDC048796]|uniref:hypothetical protein n=1 Tax=unclassified Actinoplanes TaxID=2626549 RepID=UPI0033CF6193
MTQPLPVTVRVALYFQLAVVAMLLLFIGVSTAHAIHYDGLITEAALATGADPGDVGAERSYNLTGAVLPAVPALILAVWLSITAVLVRRGNNTGRILTLAGMGAPVVLSLGGCLFGGFGVFFLIDALASGFGGDDGSADDPYEDGTAYTDEPYPGVAFWDKLADLDSSGWNIAFEVISFSALLLAFACAIVTAVLLLVGPSNRFFRPGRPQPAAPFGYGPPPAYPVPPHFASAYPAPPHPAAAYPSAAFPAPAYPQPPVPFAAPSPFAPPAPVFAPADQPVSTADQASPSPSAADPSAVSPSAPPADPSVASPSAPPADPPAGPPPSA